MKLKSVTGKYVATIKTDIDDCVVNYGKCPICKKRLEKKVFRAGNYFWGRLFCPKCNWIGFQDSLESVELDPIRSHLQDLQQQRNKLNRKIASLKKAGLKK